jgi:purine-binding chemotaxis protein CheW
VAIHPPGEGLVELSGKYLRGIATLGDRMILILDLSEVLNVSAAALADDVGTAQ